MTLKRVKSFTEKMRKKRENESGWRNSFKETRFVDLNLSTIAIYTAFLCLVDFTWLSICDIQPFAVGNTELHIE